MSTRGTIIHILGNFHIYYDMVDDCIHIDSIKEESDFYYSIKLCTKAQWDEEVAQVIGTKQSGC